MNINEAKNIISNHEYVSFDIFDTLIFRTVKEPEDVFRIVSETNTGLTDFYSLRIESEEKAREDLYPKEVTIDDIYRYIECELSIKEKYKLAEKNIEVDNCIPNPAMTELVKWCHKNEKHVIISTDMYLDRETIERILSKVSVTYEKLYISGEIGCTKASGELFEYIIKDLNVQPDEIVHTGDNFINDIENPQKYGIHTFERIVEDNNISIYKLVQNKDIQIEHQRLFVEKWLNKQENLDESYRIGFQMLGPVLYEFCIWLHEQKQSKRIDKLFFIAREGYLIKNCYQILYPEDKCDYIYLNRNLLRMAVVTKKTVMSVILESVNAVDIFTLETVFRLFNIETIVQKSIKEEILDKCIQTTFTREDILKGKANQLIDVLWKAIQETIDAQRSFLVRYLEQNGFWGKNIGLVNNSINGTVQSLLQEFLDLSEVETNIHGFQFIVSRKCKERLMANCSGWLDFLSEYDRYEFAINSILFEHMLFSEEGTAVCFNDNNGTILVTCETQRKEVNNNELIRKIQRAALEYVIEYRNHVGLAISTQSVCDYLVLIRTPILSDAITLSGLYDDDILGDRKMVEMGTDFRFSYLFGRRIPDTIKWMQGYLTGRKGTRVLLYIYNIISKVRIFSRGIRGKEI